MSMDQYIQGLFNLAKDPSADVRKLVFTVDNYLSYQHTCDYLNCALWHATYLQEIKIQMHINVIIS